MAHGRKAQRILKPRKGRIISKRDHGKNIKKQDPQSTNEKEKKTGTDRLKEDRKRKEQGTQATFHGTDSKRASGNQDREERMATNDFQKWQNRIPPK